MRHTATWYHLQFIRSPTHTRHREREREKKDEATDEIQNSTKTQIIYFERIVILYYCPPFHMVLARISMEYYGIFDEYDKNIM